MLDILPTFAALSGGKLPTDRKLDGANIWPHLTGKSMSKPAHESYFFYSGLTLQAVRHGDWKLHLATSGDGKKKKESTAQLYDLKNDIGESKNIIVDHPDKVAQLRAMITIMKDDLGLDGPAAGSRELGQVDNPKLLIEFDK